MFNKSLETCSFPVEWKKAIVCPIPKNSNKHVIQNHRPISILSAFAKIFEQIIYHYTLNYVRPLISNCQHGFLQKRSTSTNLTIMTDFLASNLDDGGQVDVIYTDFAKAFDTVDHTLLLHKLKTLDFSATTVELFGSYLSNRNQAVKYKESISGKYTMTSGVPQGSNLGPLLFLLMINDLPITILSANKLLFADDLKIYARIDSILDCEKLQHDLNAIADWCNKNRLDINVDKCKSMTYTRKHNPIQYTYKIGDTNLDKVTQIKDLGVVFDQKLTFNGHIDKISHEAYRNLGFVCRLAKDFKMRSTLISLYYAYVRSKMEYASAVWNPLHSSQNISKLERIQSKFLRIMMLKETGFYPKFDSCKTLTTNYNISSLEQRRQLKDIQFLYALLNNEIDCTDLVSQVKLIVPSNLTRHSNNKLFHYKKPRTNILSKSPIWRISTTMNKFICTNSNLDVFGMNRVHLRREILSMFK